MPRAPAAQARHSFRFHVQKITVTLKMYIIVENFSNIEAVVAKKGYAFPLTLSRHVQCFILLTGSVAERVGDGGSWSDLIERDRRQLRYFFTGDHKHF